MRANLVKLPFPALPLTPLLGGNPWIAVFLSTDEGGKKGSERPGEG